MTLPVKCPACRGDGYLEYDTVGGESGPAQAIAVTCDSCNGSGKVRTFDDGLTTPLTDDTLVEFEGEVVVWGEMMLADRKAYEAGGSFPF